jgi:aldehyde:ferredoxin oxidoreductase
MNGLAGTTLRINLRTGQINRQPTEESFARDWLGARGFVSKILYDEIPRDADPLGPLNKLIIAPGILTGAFVPAGSKVGFGAISPATNGVGDSSMGGHLGPELKAAGYDLIILEDISPEPVYVFIDDGTVELRSGDQIWGKDSLDTEAYLKEELGDEFEIATIGPAGENGVVFSCITHDFGRQAGRTGLGAVMGSKRVKALAVRGTKAIPVHDLPGLTKQTVDTIQRTKTHPNMEPWQKYGTALFVGWSNEHGTFPAYNFKGAFYDHWEKISGQTLAKEILVTHKACHGCWMNCGKYTRAQIQGRDPVYVEGPEYETIALCGGSVGMQDINHVAFLNYTCDSLGLDTMSGGSTTAFAMECFEKGIITEEDLGFSLHWGDVEAAERFLKLVAAREGIGAVFAQGTKRAAETLGQESIRFANQAKGMEFSGYDTRWYPSQLLSFCTADIGAHHNRSWAITVDMELGRDVYEGKAPVVIYLQHIRPLFDALSICRLFWGELDVMPEENAEALRKVTGWDVSLDDLLLISERIWNLNRAHFLLRNGGPGRNHDRAPLRHLEEPVPDGPAKGSFTPLEAFEKMLDEYYYHRGWDRVGNPTRDVLELLGIADAANELEKRGLLGEPIPGGIPEVRGQELKPAAM